MKNIVVSGYTEQLTASSGWIISAYLVSSEGIPSLFGKADNKGIMKDGTTAIISNIAATHSTQGAFIQLPPATFTIDSSASKTKVENSFVLLEGDESSSVTVSGNITPPGGSPAPGTISATLKIISAGQLKITGS